jgi:uncharacterized protein (DUF433 family)
MPNLLQRITVVQGLCNGKPTIRGMRITVKTVLEYLAAGDTIADILEAYPFLVFNPARALSPCGVEVASK